MDYQTGYAHYLTEEKHASDNTLSSYLRDVNQFLRWLAGEGLLPELAEPPEAASLLAGSEDSEPPQAARLMAMTAAKSAARIFLIYFIPFSFFGFAKAPL